ncbi:MAG: hypothetical protein J5I94_26105 [Phaeodactylibacter sp.]|nr:hypothetical protein [Phaeodactylibacter sp.]
MKAEGLIIFLALAFPWATVAGQEALPANAAPGLQAYPQVQNDTARMRPGYFSLPSLSSLPFERRERPSPPPGVLTTPEIPRAYSYDKLGAFCKWEVQLERAARVPVKFRLGEVQYVERLEGKLPDF